MVMRREQGVSQLRAGVLYPRSSPRDRCEQSERYDSADKGRMGLLLRSCRKAEQVS